MPPSRKEAPVVEDGKAVNTPFSYKNKRSQPAAYYRVLDDNGKWDVFGNNNVNMAIFRNSCMNPFIATERM